MSDPRAKLHEWVDSIPDSELEKVLELLRPMREGDRDEERFDRIAKEVLREYLGAFKQLAQ